MDNTIRVQDHPLIAVAWKNVEHMEKELLDYLADDDIEYTAEEAKLINDDLPF